MTPAEQYSMTMLVVLSLFALAAVVADVIARLIVAPNRKDRHYEELLESLVEPDPPAHAAAVDPSDPALARISENLLRHFGHLAASRRILDALATEGGRMSESGVLAAVNGRLQAARKPPLPPSAARKVIRILERADFVALRDGILHITDAGRQLHSLLSLRRQEIAPEPAMAGS